jgi:hypothetical protein
VGPFELLQKIVEVFETLEIPYREYVVSWASKMGLLEIWESILRKIN